ncbi:rod shape-determining protein RodA [Pseudoduganella sp. DS3]|uniref:Peptidoglycan glycosyltransferase MrdB n=1 Tax=Pseudoduganella guangdongensis TaxID=2692179 RepID=A0A6N9HL74_9BURK|nr:rod shape-determining protein RodA [Pseudoduganella guangdongensis]MYN03943.1 rod shape-determining protein RodA [Pseudoduganella guangdongensis]
MTLHTPSWRRLRPVLAVDAPLAAIVGILVCTGLFTLYSASADFPGRFELQLRNVLMAVGLMWAASNVPQQVLMRHAAALYALGVALLVAVFLFGVTKKGSTRWLNLGHDFQPSEMMKIAMPLMLAWYFHRYDGVQGWRRFAVAALLLAIPVGLIAKQPDFGTAMLVLSAGFYVIVLAGLSWKALAALAASALAAAPLVWHMLHDFQRQRVLTFLDPGADPMGKGFQINQAMTAIGSGGMTGRGWMDGTQGHLGFIPERSTDFIFSVFAEEFGLVGGVVLLLMYALLVVRGLQIAAGAPTPFSRLLGGAITMIFFTYAFINIGMVSGVVPVVGVPLPFFSYGGTALATLGLGCGILMSIRRSYNCPK